MKGQHFTEEQITYALRQAESGVPVAEVCYKLQVAELNQYRWEGRCFSLGIVELDVSISSRGRIAS